MNIFKRIYKKIFGEKEQVDEKKQDCQYNNTNEVTSSKSGIFMEVKVAFSDPNQVDFVVPQRMTQAHF